MPQLPRSWFKIGPKFFWNFGPLGTVFQQQICPEAQFTHPITLRIFEMPNAGPIRAHLNGYDNCGLKVSSPDLAFTG
jgi:hypothetical protein